MTVITAVFGAASAASAAAEDIEVARIPSASITRDTRSTDALSRQCAVVTVAVDELHEETVSGILGMYAPVTMRQRSG
jgi:hypothetical protein